MQFGAVDLRLSGPAPDGAVARRPGIGGRIVVNMVRRVRQKVVPHLSYEDPFAALEWLCRVFGFTEARRFDRGDKNLTARLKAPDGGVVMISRSEDDFREWMRERAPRFEEATGRTWPLLTHAISVFVDDVDTHFARATQHGAAVLGEPKDQPCGVRSYAVLDPEGHHRCTIRLNCASKRLIFGNGCRLVAGFLKVEAGRRPGCRPFAKTRN